MDVAWGDAADGGTAGLDIAGVRALDQQMEATLVNGITTVSLRGRYWTILPWAIAEFFSAEAEAGETSYSKDRFAAFLRRIEFLVLACTTVDEGGAAGGALGTLTYERQMKALVSGVAAPFPADGGGAMLGTYFGPCRALGLLANAVQDSSLPVVVTLRGKAAWEARRKALDGTAWRQVISSEHIRLDDARALVPHFSLRSMGSAPAEAAVLRIALLEPWRPSDGAAARVAEAYGRFAQTVDWMRAGTGGNAPRADFLLKDAWRRVSMGEQAATVDVVWAEYEWRCRLHFSIELMLSAVSAAVEAQNEVTLERLIEDWLAEPDVPAVLATAWPEAASAAAMSGASARASVPADLWITESMPANLDRMLPHARALTAFALVTALANQSVALRADGRFADRRTIGERTLACVESAGEESFAETLRGLARVAIEAHLATTFRKMGGRQKCSLRFFPEGPKLISTGTSTRPGRSGTRLWNLIRVLQDAGVLGLGAAA